MTREELESVACAAAFDCGMRDAEIRRLETQLVMTDCALAGTKEADMVPAFAREIAEMRLALLPPWARQAEVEVVYSPRGTITVRPGVVYVLRDHGAMYRRNLREPEGGHIAMTRVEVAFSALHAMLGAPLPAHMAEAGYRRFGVGPLVDRVRGLHGDFRDVIDAAVWKLTKVGVVERDIKLLETGGVQRGFFPDPTRAAWLAWIGGPVEVTPQSVMRSSLTDT